MCQFHQSLDLIKAGLKVVGCARREEKLEELSKTVAGEVGKVDQPDIPCCLLI